MSYSVTNKGKRFSAYARAVVGDHPRIERRSGFHTYEAAEQWARATEARLLGQDPPTGTVPLTWGQLTDWIYREHYRHLKSTKSARSLLTLSGHMIGAKRPLLSISRPLLRECVNGMSGYAPASIRRVMGIIMKTLREAHREGWIPEVPSAPPLPSVTRRRIRVLSDDELNAVMRHMTDNGAQDSAELVCFLVHTGLRMGEAMGLRIRDVDFDRRELTVRVSKSGRPRTIPVHHYAMRLLRARQLQDHVFEVPATSAFRRAWDLARASLGMTRDRDFVPHALRHTFASKLAVRGVSLHAIKDLLGHSKIDTTLVYAHLSQDHLRQAVDQLSPAPAALGVS